MTMTADLTLLEQLKDEKRQLDGELYGLIEAREAERRAFEARATSASEAEIKQFHAAEALHRQRCEKVESRLTDLERRIKDQKALEKRREKAAGASINIRVTSEPLTYRQDNSQAVSYFRDLAVFRSEQARSRLSSTTLEQSTSRLEAHAREMAIEMPARAARREARALRRISEMEEGFRRSVPSEVRRQLDAQDFSPFERRVTPNRTDGAGGFFVPPYWVNEYIQGLRPGRTTAGLCQSVDLPSGTDVIVVPKLANLTAVGVQGADNQPVQETDWSDTAVVAPVKTLAGMSDIPVQLLEQSPYAVDKMIITDLLADYDKQLNLQIIQGNGSVSNSVTPTVGGQIAGLYSSAGASNWGSYNSITYTTGSPAPWHLFSVAGAMQSKIAENRYLFDDTLSIVVHPRRAWWYASGTDAQNRPLVESRNFGPFNVQGIEPDSVPAQGCVSQLPWGTRLYADPSVPTNDAGAGQDIALAFLGSDAWLFEGDMHTDLFSEVLSGTLQIRFRVYAYCAFLLRYGQSLAIASGTGFAAPTGAVSSITF